jgi:hypothetical protein
MGNFMERAPGTVELDEPKCHALEYAFENNPEAITQLTELADEKELRVWAEELKGTARLIFVPSETMKTVYFQIADAEIKRLAHENSALYCGHSSEEHLKALRSVESMFAQPVN